MKSSNKKPRKRTEEHIHNKTCNYFRHHFSYVEFMTDLSGLKLPLGYATKIRALRSREKGISDFLAFEPRGGFKGFFLELKSEDSSFLKKDGEISSVEHFQKQHEFLTMMRFLGYYAEFAPGWEEVEKHIKKYMSLPPDYDLNKRLELLNRQKEAEEVRYRARQEKALQKKVKERLKGLEFLDP